MRPAAISLVVAALSIAPPLAAQVQIGHMDGPSAGSPSGYVQPPSWPYAATSEMGALGKRLHSGTQGTRGQTFSAPDAASTHLESFAWSMDGSSFYGSEAVTFEGYLYEWDENLVRPTGPLLWQSGPVQYSTDPTTRQYSWGYRFREGHGRQVHVFNTGGIDLDPADTYIFFLGVGDHLDAIPDGAGAHTAMVGSAGGDGWYPGGGLYYTGNWTSDRSEVLNTSWTLMTHTTDPDHQYDGSFCATFTDDGAGGDLCGPESFATVSTVPEPATLLLLGTGLLGLAALGRRGRVPGR